MKLSLEWLKSYVDLPALTPDEIAHQLTMATAEVEGVDRLERITGGVVAAEVTAVETLDTGDADKTISYVTVDTGAGTAQTVCGAPNVVVGMNTAYVPPGTTIAGGFAVREQEVYGRQSQGMLASARELGWGEFHLGILAFPETLVPGTPLADLVSAEDHIIDIDNKTITHRPDLWGHYGFARELAAIYGCELKPLGLADDAAWQSLPAFPLRIEDYENCPGYCCLDMDGLSPAYAPVWMQRFLLAVGLRPINLLVDLTNYIMCELGQPMHAFNGERVRDVVVKPFGAKGTFRTLDSVDREMIPDDLMICDHGGPVALAGIMGGEESEIKEDTSRVLLESANFNPARIRRTSLRLNLRSDASMRFEKGQPPYHMAVSIRRFVQLLEDAGQAPEVKSQLTCDGDSGMTERRIVVPLTKLDRAIGMDIPRDRTTGILTSLGFDCDIDGDILTVTVPRWRSVRDISIPNDIVEEVARIYGYDNITPVMPETGMRAYQFNALLDTCHKIQRFLSTARGYYETHTYSWYDDVWLKRIGYDPGETLTLQNPAAENTTRMRRELLPNLLALVEPNAAHQDRFAVYETGNVHISTADGREQQFHVAGVSYQSAKLGLLQDQFLAVKGTVDELFRLMNLDAPEYRAVESTQAPWQQEGATLEVLSNGSVVGTLGYLTDATFPAFDPGCQVVWFELRLDDLTAAAYPSAQYDHIPVYPGSWMDFSVLSPKDMPFSELDMLIGQFTNDILKQYRFLYRYQGKGLPEGMVSSTFRFWLGLPDRTLTGEDLSAFHTEFIAFLGANGLTIR